MKNAEIIKKFVAMGFVAKEASVQELNNTFAEACVNQNSLVDLLEDVSEAQARADMEAWGLSHEEYKRQIGIAVQHLAFVKICEEDEEKAAIFNGMLGFEVFNAENDGQCDVGITTKAGQFMIQRGTDFVWSIPSGCEANAGDEELQEAWCEKSSSELRSFVIGLFGLDEAANSAAGIETGMPEGFSVLFEPNSLLNGYAWRSIKKGDTVKIQFREVGGCGSLDEYITQKTMPREEFESWANAGLYDPYDDNPAKLLRLVQQDDPFFMADC